MKTRGWIAFLLPLVISAATLAQAPTAPPPPPPPAYAPAPSPAPENMPSASAGVPPRVLRDVSLTISPLHLINPVVELTLEARVADRVGLALIGAVGQMSTTSSGGTRHDFSAYELGTSFRYYAVGDFNSGMQLGAELLWVHVTLDSSTSGSDVSGVGAGVAMGPMIGYKYTADVGFTFDGQLGFQWIALTAKASSGGDTMSAEQKRLIPLLNVNVGWSF